MGGGGVLISGPIGAGQDYVIVGSLNNDNFDDLMLVRQDGIGNIEWLPLLNDGTGILLPDLPFIPFGLDNGGDVPFLADIDGDGIDDLGVTRNSFENFALLSGGAGLETWNFGQTGDIHLFGQFNIPEPSTLGIAILGVMLINFSRKSLKYA